MLKHIASIQATVDLPGQTVFVIVLPGTSQVTYLTGEGKYYTNVYEIPNLHGEDFMHVMNTKIALQGLLSP